jgi:ubiquinone/menaquinone biosynthesis C-methylase UbiE/DNA-binding transcriptional MerR regulator
MGVIKIEEKQEELFTIGEFAARAGVTQRAIRYYDNIGLLKPCTYKNSGHRLYSRHDFARLQKILTLKFIGLSLEEIADIMKHDIKDQDFKKSLEIQRDIIDKKIHHMHMVMGAIDETLDMLGSSNRLNWDKFINIIKILNIDKNWMEQYENSSNLRARIRIHEHFSANKYGWMRWYFEQLCIQGNASILELGCGDGSLWAKNADRIPEGWDITLTDFSPGMLKDAKDNLSGIDKSFNFKLADAMDIPFDEGSFDVVMANHMLYHVPDIDRAFSEIYRVLKPGGLFYASTVGKDHMAEMREIADRLNSGTGAQKSRGFTGKFQLENGLEQVSKWFESVQVKRYEDHLVVTEAGPLIDYIFSMPGNSRESFDSEKLEQIIESLEDEIHKTGGIYISKDTGFFQGKKSNKAQTRG